jgi:cytoskeletal protein CcmA (bactofilin family)
MSFKDDFFEALRSVKRDFLREPDPTLRDEQPGQQFATFTPPVPERPEVTSAPVPDDAPPPASLEDTGEFRMPDNIFTADDVPPPSSPRSDREVLDAFIQASAIDEEPDGDAESDFVDESESIHTTGGDGPAPFRNYEPSYPDIAEYPPSEDGRKIFDFEADSLYADDKTVISRNTIIRGALQTDDSMRLLGQILGDIDCKSNIVVAGKIRGNTTAANAYIVDAQIDGNMVCDDAVNVNKDAWVLGNIRAQQAEIDGKVKGNIEIRHAVSIGSASSVIGNISTDELEIKRGAFVNGQIIMYSPSRDVIDRFDDFERG